VRPYHPFAEAIRETGGESCTNHVNQDTANHCHVSETVIACDMGKKFVSVTLDLDEETLTMLEQASAKRGSTVSQMAHELISKALHEIMPSREDVLRAVEEAIRGLSDKGRLLDQLFALAGKAREEKSEPANEASHMAFLMMQTGANVFGSEQGFLEWLSIPTPALEDKTPLSLLSSPAGLLKVIDVLGTIERRVPS